MISNRGRPFCPVRSRVARRFACPSNVPVSPQTFVRPSSYPLSCYTRGFHLVFAVLQVRVAGYSGYLDGTVEICNWLKFIRSTNDGSGQNVRAFLLAGQVPNVRR